MTKNRLRPQNYTRAKTLVRNIVKTQTCNVSSVPKTSDHSNHDKEGDQPLPEEKIFKDDELVNMIDPILATDDKNHDGFIDYPEFVMAQQAATARS